MGEPFGLVEENFNQRRVRLLFIVCLSFLLKKERKNRRKKKGKKRERQRKKKTC